MSYLTNLNTEASKVLKKQKTTSGVFSIGIALLVVIVGTFLLRLLIVLTPGSIDDGGFTCRAPAPELAEDIQVPKVQLNRVQVSTPRPALTTVSHILSQTVSHISIPHEQSFQEVESLEVSADVFGDGFDTFDVGDGTKIFDAEISGRRICYVIDYSASMRSKGREVLMRNELAKSVQGLEGGPADYNLIFFAGAVWQAGDTVVERRKDRTATVTDTDGKQYKWANGRDGIPKPDKKEKMAWRDANSDNIESSLEDIKTTPLAYGTHWQPPLEFAINMQPTPDVIVFMTDGIMKNAEKVASDMGELAYEKGIQINSISLIEPDAKEGMIMLAEKTGGSATLVLGEGEVVDLLDE